MFVKVQQNEIGGLGNIVVIPGLLLLYKQIMVIPRLRVDPYKKVEVLRHIFVGKKNTIGFRNHNC